MPLDPRAIQLHTDGSCDMKQRRISGCAAFVVYPDHLGRAETQIVDFGCEESSNNRMELMACCKALHWVLGNAPWENVTRVYVVTDSQYLADNFGRAHFWKKARWRNLSGEPTANEDLWNHIIRSTAKISKLDLRVDVFYQKGKKSELGKRVDKAAKTAAQRGGFDEDFGYTPGSYARSMVPGGTTAERFPASGQVLVIRPYAKKVRRKREERISFNIFDEVTQTYSGKFFAFTDPSLSAELHRGNGHRVHFNSDPNFPQILERIEDVQLPKPVKKNNK